MNLSARWFNWRWRPANIWGRYRLRYLPTMTPEGRAGQEDAALRRGGGSGPAPPGCSCEPKRQAFHQGDCPYAKDRPGLASGSEVPHSGGGWRKRLWHRLTCSGYIGTKWCRDPAHDECDSNPPESASTLLQYDGEAAP